MVTVQVSLVTSNMPLGEFYKIKWMNRTIREKLQQCEKGTCVEKIGELYRLGKYTQRRVLGVPSESEQAMVTLTYLVANLVQIGGR